MKTAVLCVLLTSTLVQAFTIPSHLVPASPAPPTAVQGDHKLEKRFIATAMMLPLMMTAMMDDDDYFDALPRRRRPSRRTLQLAQMMRQLAGAQGLTSAQMQNIMQNMQNLQTMQTLQQVQNQPQAG